VNGVAAGFRVVIADDHATFVRTLASVLRSAGVDVAGTAADGDEALRVAIDAQPDVVLMDVHMPGIDGIEATAQLSEAAPHVAVVVLTMFDDDDSVFAAMQAGARGYLVKGAPADEILRAVEAAARGEAIFGAAVARRLRAFFQARTAAVDDGLAAFPQLTDREREVLDQLAAGHDNAAIATRLYLSQKTVRNYVSSIFAKLQVAGRSEAIVKARDAGLGRSARATGRRSPR
jgi:DNA-binding NarL/FixJ family response regulator